MEQPPDVAMGAAKKLVAPDDMKAPGPVWMWWDENSWPKANWRMFTRGESARLEDSYDKMKRGEWPPPCVAFPWSSEVIGEDGTPMTRICTYVCDFRAMTQCNEDTNCTRDILRVIIEPPGI
jgi:hypothetical protein